MALRPTISSAAAIAVFSALGGVAATAATPPGTPAASVALSTDQPGARPVAVTVRLHYEMQCAWPGPGPLTIRFPAAMSVPLTIRPATVLIDGTPVKRVGVTEHDVVLTLPPRPQILCDVIGPGTLTIVFTRAVRLGNPRLPGTYRLRGTKESLSFLTALTIRRR